MMDFKGFMKQVLIDYDIGFFLMALCNVLLMYSFEELILKKYNFNLQLVLKRHRVI